MKRDRESWDWPRDPDGDFLEDFYRYMSKGPRHRVKEDQESAESRLSKRLGQALRRLFRRGSGAYERETGSQARDAYWSF